MESNTSPHPSDYRREANPLAGEVACEPFKTNSLELRRVGGIVLPNHRDVLTGLVVIYGTDKFHTGDKVYFEGDQCATLWAKRVYALDDGTKFILAPVANVKLVERACPPPAVGHPEAVQLHG